MDDERTTALRTALILDLRSGLPAIYGALLAPAGYTLVHADTGAEALARAIADPPDLIVLHAEGGVIDGVSLCRLLRDDPATHAARILLVVRHTDEARTALEAGATGVVREERLGDDLLDQIENSTSARTPPPAIGRSTDLRCPECDARLVLRVSYTGGVKTRRERWDLVECPRCYGRFEFRHRTRRLCRVRQVQPAN